MTPAAERRADPLVAEGVGEPDPQSAAADAGTDERR
jgi:hypothetical protein